MAGICPGRVRNFGIARRSVPICALLPLRDLRGSQSGIMKVAGVFSWNARAVIIGRLLTGRIQARTQDSRRSSAPRAGDAKRQIADIQQLRSSAFLKLCASSLAGWTI